jgi:hypothetical protein
MCTQHWLDVDQDMKNCHITRLSGKDFLVKQFLQAASQL